MTDYVYKSMGGKSYRQQAGAPAGSPASMQWELTPEGAATAPDNRVREGYKGAASTDDEDKPGDSDLIRAGKRARRAAKAKASTETSSQRDALAERRKSVY